MTGVQTCALPISLPVPSKFLSPSGEQVNNFVTRTVPDYLEQGILQRQGVNTGI